MKIVTVLNKELEPGVALNAAAHLALGLAAKTASESATAAMMFQNYRDRDGRGYPFFSSLSLIVLRGKTGKIRKFHQACLDQNISHSVFLKEMTGDTHKQQLERLLKTPSENVGCYGVCALPESSVLDPLTKRFLLWKDRAPDSEPINA